MMNISSSFLTILLISWILNCSNANSSSSKLTGNVVAHSMKYLSPSQINSVQIMCQFAHRPERSYNKAKGWNLLMQRQFGDSYVAYLKSNAEKDETLVTTGIVNYDGAVTQASDRNYRKPFTTFTSGLFKFDLKIFHFPGRWNTDNHYYNAEFTSRDLSLNPLHSVDVICTGALSAVIEKNPLPEDKLLIHGTIKDPISGRLVPAKKQITVDQTTSVNGRELIYSLTKFSPNEEIPINSPVFTADGKFAGFLLKYRPDVPTSIEILSIHDIELSYQLESENPSWSDWLPEESPAHGISRRFKDVICNHLLNGHPAPGTYPRYQGWESEWQEIAKSANLILSTCPKPVTHETKVTAY